MASGMSRDEILAFFERRQQKYDALDAAGLAADYADTAVIDSPMAGGHGGPVAAELALQGFFAAFLDVKFKTESLLIDGNRVAQIGTIEGTQTGYFMGLPPSGKHFSVPAVTFFEIEDGKIVRERRIYDFTGLLLRLGVLKAKPAL